MTGEERRKKIIEILRQASGPLSGGAIGEQTGVSRQVVVQDIALLRTQGVSIIATAKGYLLQDANKVVRLFKVCHTEEQTEDELLTIIDIGGCVEDVTVNHRVYGKMSAILNVKSRRDVKLFMEDMTSGKSTPLMNVTSGYHFHQVTAEQEEVLDEIEEALTAKGYLVELMPYELNGDR